MRLGVQLDLAAGNDEGPSSAGRGRCDERQPSTSSRRLRVDRLSELSHVPERSLLSQHADAGLCNRVVVVVWPIRMARPVPPASVWCLVGLLVHRHRPTRDCSTVRQPRPEHQTRANRPDLGVGMYTVGHQPNSTTVSSESVLSRRVGNSTTVTYALTFKANTLSVVKSEGSVNRQVML